MNGFLKDFTLKPQYQVIGTCEIEISKPFCLVIFGAHGDLAKKKLLPSLFHLFIDGLLPENSFIYGADRVDMSIDSYRNAIKDALQQASPKSFNNASWENFAQRLYYVSFDFSLSESYVGSIERKLPELEKKHKTDGNRIFYLAIPPAVFENVIDNIGLTGLAQEKNGYAHIVIEKPFGRDLYSAQRLNRVLHQYFKENQIFRIDHYVAKEMVQNMLMFRFANSIFEPLWNRRYIDHVQITASETIGVGSTLL